MTKKLLEDAEVRLMRGLMKHTTLNDQAITAVFSHLDRNINSRETGAVRAGRGKYAGAPAASKDETNRLLARYRRLQILARRIGVSPSDDLQVRVEKGVELMKSAAIIYNTNTIGFRSEIFIINAIIAWTYVLHAFYIDAGISPVYEKDGAPVKTQEGDDKLWDLSECLKHVDCPLKQGAVNNLRYLLTLRHEIEHRVARDIDESVQSKVQACAINFSEFCEGHFGPEFSLKYDLDFAIQFVKLTMQSENLSSASADIPIGVRAVNKLLEADMSEEDYNDPQYAFRVYVVPKTVNNPKKADKAVNYAPVGSAIEMALKYVERPKHRAKAIIEKLKSRGHSISQRHFQDIWKQYNLKDSRKNLAAEVGGQWFWYDEVVDFVVKVLEE